MTTISERLTALRAAMQQNHIAAYLVPSTDPHASEYVADHWKERQWISGFTGSAGTVVITLHAAALWTDSRYFLQAENQLADSGICLQKDGIQGTPSISEWLRTNLHAGETIALNAELYDVNSFGALRDTLAEAGLKLIGKDLIAPLWKDRPEIPIQPFFVLEEQYAGRSVAEKLADVRLSMKLHKADAYAISELDEIAWLFNIRGTDVDYNPVVVAYALVETNQCTLFVSPDKLTPDTIAYLVKNKVSISDYTNIYTALRTLSDNSCLLYDGSKLNQALYEVIPNKCAKKAMQSPIKLLKSLKNETELAGVRRAMLADGVALTRFFIWLEQAMASGNITECDIMVRLKEFRAQNAHFVGESFGTIAGYGANGAIVHYEAEEATCATLKPDNLLLLDSGGQYFDGTTDITRTISLGTPTAQQKHDFTLVLKGHIALACAQFPQGTRGCQLDILARQFLWQEGLHYGHGTGHGIGHFLCVHEGPQSIRTNENPTPLQPGMLLSDEPGLYRAGQYGIRIENMVAVEEKETTDFATFYGFETLTLCPYDQKLIEWTMLSHAEIEWLNNYHKRVYTTLSPLLNAAERTWLAAQCACKS